VFEEKFPLRLNNSFSENSIMTLVYCLSYHSKQELISSDLVHPPHTVWLRETERAIGTLSSVCQRTEVLFVRVGPLLCRRSLPVF